jgi:hypothetical protein
MGTGTTPIEQIFGVQVTLNSTAVPSASITGGTLTGGGAHAGTQTVGVHAASTESGVARLEVLLDGQVVGANDYTANASLCPYTNFAACRQALDDTVSADTTKVSNGLHNLAIRVTDAAGNPTVQNAGSVEVANTASPVDRGAPNGLHASDRARMTQAGKRWLRLRYGRKQMIAGRLLDEHGLPISAATLDVQSQVLLAGATFQTIGHVTTAADGSYRVVVPAGPSRYVRIGYRSHLADRSYAAAADVGELVSAAAKLSTSPRHVRNGQRVVFRGRILGGWIPARGEPVEIQAKVGRSWHDVMAALARRGGRFRASYRFTRTPERVTYTFRAVVRSTAGYPYAPGASNPARVGVN